ncbi:glycosyltransferase family 2 protein [Candidatus Proelusimicrobium volucris]|uniref:glycosyltransferase family 2 protein n=1 Tax=Candidatus Proelusimicrobium volucris TaxID=3416225 RepID=UPI003D117847
MSPQISIIIPVYNSEKFLRQALQSAAEQTFKDIEVLCVDNASKDSSPEIIKEFAGKYPNFHYLYKEGGMAGGARNEGLKHAKGKYVLFFDSDDILRSDACEILYKKAEEEKSDIVTCSCDRIDESDKKLSKCNLKGIPATLSKPAATRANFLFIGAGIIGRPWGSLIKRSIIEENHLRFPEGRGTEDVPFMGALFALANKFIFIDEPLIDFRDTTNSLGKRSSNNSANINFENFSYIRNYLNGLNIYPEIKEEFEYILLKQIIGGECIGNGALKQSDKTQTKEFFEKSKNFYLNLPSDLFKERNFIFKVKLALFKFALRHNLYFMPRLARVITNPFIFFYGIFFPLKEISLSGLPEE